jgi:hypothetical protein
VCVRIAALPLNLVIRWCRHLNGLFTLATCFSFLTACSTSRNFTTNAILSISLGFVQKRNRVCKSRLSEFMLEKNGLHSVVAKENILSLLDSERMLGTSLGLTPCRPCMV